MNRRQFIRGFTLVEMVATIVILSIALVAVAGMVSLGTSNSATTMVQVRAIALGESYLDEIMGRRFDERSDAGGRRPCFDTSGPGRNCTAEVDFGPDGGESSRDRYDDVDDYHDLREGDGQADPIRDAEGNEREGYENFLVDIQVRYAGDDPALGGMMHETNAKLITVTVTTRGQGNGWTFAVYRGNY